jgi:hypothetical protein
VNYKKMATSAEVWAVIKARHNKDLVVFGTYSAPDGDEYIGDSSGRMDTSYGFKDADYPLMEASTTWTIDRDKPSSRIDEITEYWLCVPIDL